MLPKNAQDVITSNIRQETPVRRTADCLITVQSATDCPITIQVVATLLDRLNGLNVNYIQNSPKQVEFNGYIRGDGWESLDQLC